MFGTVVLYTIIYSALNTRLRPDSIASTTSLAPLSTQVSAPDPRTINRAARYMVIYPTIYVLCTLPLAAGRMVAMTGHVIPYWYYCIAGAAITSCGWLDVVLYALTRRVLVFSDAPPPIDEYGLETFGIFHSPEEFWSVRIVVEGGVLVDPTVSTRRRERHKEPLFKDGCIQSPRGAMDDTFDIAMPGSISTKTTLTVTTEPRMLALRESTVELPGPAIKPTTKSGDAASERGVTYTTRGHEEGKEREKEPLDL
jgi:hypothetical protein